MDIIRKYSYPIGGIFVIIIFIVTWLLFYRFALRKPKEDIPDQEDQSCQLIFFYTTWCPACKKARPEWDKFKIYWNHKNIDGYVLSFSEIDCDTHEDIANKYNVINYPDIKLIKNNKTFNYDAKPTVETLNQFLTSCFN